MVFGNMGETSPPASPSPATPRPAQRALRRVPGQRAGRGRRRRHPHAAEDHRGRAQGGRLRQARRWKRLMPEVFAQFVATTQAARKALPRHAGHRVHRRARQALDAADPQRQAHRAAALRIAVEMADEGLITKEEAITRIEPASLDQLLHPTIDPKAERERHRHRPAGLARRGDAARSCSPPTRPRSCRRPATR